MKMHPFNEFAFDYMENLQYGLDHMNLEEVAKAVKLIQQCKGTVWLIGNGGSAALASHMATDLQLAGIRAISLTDVASITTIGNDQSYFDTFSLQLKRLARPGDLLVAITGSGKSRNILRALSVARDSGMLSILLTGFDGGNAGDMFHERWNEHVRFKGVHINMPVKHMGVSQDGHQIILHMICYYLMGEKK